MPRRWRVGVLAALALAVLSLGRAAGTDAGIASYPATTFFLSNAASAQLSTSYQLINGSAAAQPSTTLSTCTNFPATCPAGGLTGTYAYEYTLVDTTFGETAPSAVASSPSVTSKSIVVNNLPTGVSVDLYRQKTSGAGSPTRWTRVATLANNASATLTDNMADGTALTQTALPISQNRMPGMTTGYQEFDPGGQAPASATTSVVASPTVDGSGWIVDGGGGVHFPQSNWTFQAKVKQTAPNGVAHLAVGMWAVTVSGNAITGSRVLVDPTCSATPCSSPTAAPGEDTTTNFATANGTTIQQTVQVNEFWLDSNEHLYVQYWRYQTTGQTSGLNANNELATMYVNDGTAQITHPAANTAPDQPSLLAPADGIRANNTTPSLQASYADADGNSGTLTFELCSDASCSSTLTQSGFPHTTSTMASGNNATWSPTALADGTYYWRAVATDSVGNPSETSAVRSFTVDTTAPSAPPLVSPAAGLRTNNTTPALTATYTDTPAGGTGTLSFQLCRQTPLPVTCSPGTASGVPNGSNGSWTPSSLSDGTYTWQAQATDAAGNVSAWSSTHSFVVDTNPPLLKSFSGPSAGAWLSTLPSLSGKWGANGDSGDSGTINAQLCSDATCTSTVWTGSSASGIADNGTGSVTPSVAGNGTYYWRVQAQDAAGNVSAWSSPITSFTWDDTPPATPTPSPAIAARVAAAPTLTAPYSDPQFADSGTVTFDICMDAGCSLVLQSNTQSSVPSGTNASWTPSILLDGLFYWKVTSTDAAGNRSTASGSFTVDTTAPSAPLLVSPADAVRTSNTTPPLTATYSDTPAGGTGTLSFQLCPQSGPCTPGSASGVSNGSDGTWTPPSALADGTFTWKVQATDAVGNVSSWSSTRSFVVDTTTPSVPTLGTVAARVSTAPQLSATFNDPDAGDTGTALFQVCSDSSCSSVVTSGSSAAGVVSSGSGTWTPSGLAPASYYWRASAQDAAGNRSAWSATGQFAYDTTPPSVPTVSAPADGVRLNQPPSLTAVYVDPSAGVGDSGTLTYEICPTSTCATPLVTRTSGSLVSGASDGWTPSLGDGTYYWRVASQDSAGNGSEWSATRSFTVDQTPPNAPELAGAPGMRVRTSPALTARVSDPSDPGDSARIYVEVCADPGCASVLASGYSGTVADGTLAGWTAPALADGTYYWRAMAEDVVGNQSGWSATRSFLVDDSAPPVPVASGATDAAVVNKIQLTGVFSSSDPGDSGMLEFQLCADEACASVVVDGSAGPVAPGGRAAWTADAAALEDGVYFWRVRAKDAAGNVSPWSTTRSLTLDDTPPGPPQDFRARISGRTLTLTWRPPAKSSTVRGYALIVNGKKTQTLTATTRKIRIHLRRNDRRSFAIVAVDGAGNMSDATRTVEMVGPRLSVKGTRVPGAFHRR